MTPEHTQQIVQTLLNAGFGEEFESHTFYRHVNDYPRTRVRVRIPDPNGLPIIDHLHGEEDIAIVATYQRPPNFASPRDINITLIQRMPTTHSPEAILQNAREVYLKARYVHEHQACPECSAPTFVSKKGNRVCALLCWLDLKP